MRPDRDTQREQARDVFTRCRIDRSADFFTLSSSQVGELLEFADLWKYRKPKNASASRGRYFFALLQRRAA